MFPSITIRRHALHFLSSWCSQLFGLTSGPARPGPARLNQCLCSLFAPRDSRPSAVVDFLDSFRKFAWRRSERTVIDFLCKILHKQAHAQNPSPSSVVATSRTSRMQDDCHNIVLESSFNFHARAESRAAGDKLAQRCSLSGLLFTLQWQRIRPLGDSALRALISSNSSSSREFSLVRFRFCWPQLSGANFFFQRPHLAARDAF